MQVTWGASVYRQQCARCHEPGWVAPVLTQERLIRYGNADHISIRRRCLGGEGRGEFNLSCATGKIYNYELCISLSALANFALL